MELTKLKINFLGDSITQGVGADSPEYNYVNQVAKKTGATVRNYGVSGTRFAVQKEEFCEEFSERFIERAKKMEDDADYVFVFGGTNDFGHGDSELGSEDDTDPNTFGGACNELFSYLKNRYGSEKIVVMLPLHRTNENETKINDISKPILKKFSEVIKYEIDIAKKYGLNILDVYDIDEIDARIESQNKKYYMDGLHPNNLGHEFVANKIVEYLNK